MKDATSLARILLVEDGASVVPRLASTLGELRYRVAGRVSSWEDAISEATRLQPSLLLIDSAPTSKLEGTRVIREFRKVHDLPIVCLSACCDCCEIADKWMNAPVTCLAKPFQPSDLRNAIEISLLHHQLEQRLRESEKLREARTGEAMARLSGGVAHVFNNLLTVILGHAELLSPDLAAEELREHADKIKSAAKQAAKVTRQLVAVARRQEPSLQLLDLNYILWDIFQSVSQKLAGKNIECHIVSAPEPAHVQLDPAQLHEVVQALVNNAAEAMPKGGQLTVKITLIELDRDDHAHHFQLATGRYVALEVSDTGTGMAPEVRSRLFEPFFSTKEFGHGLSLAAAYGIVSQNGGSISVHSEPGEGTVFKIYLPYARTEDTIRFQAEAQLSA